MKITSRFAVLFVALLGYAQAFTQVTNQRLTMSEGVYEALVLSIPDLNAKNTSDVWVAFTKDQFDARTKYDRKTKQYNSEDLKIAALGRGSQVSLHAQVEEQGNGAVIRLWVRKGDAFINAADNREEYMEAEKILLDFGIECGKEKIRIDIAAQEKQLEALHGDLKKLEGEKSSLERDIEKAQEAIRQAEAGLEDNAKNQEAKQAEIKAQNDLIEATKRKLNGM